MNIRFVIMAVIFLIGAMSIFLLFKKEFKTNVIEQIFLETGIFTETNISSGRRLQDARSTFKVFLNHPVVGVSLGGIPAGRGELAGLIVTSQAQAKNMEGIVVLFEVLAASGIVGFIFFVLYFLKLTVKPVIKKNKILSALVISLIFEFIMLQFNQNILRLYFWVHVAMLSAFYHVYGKDKERFMRLKHFW